MSVQLRRRGRGVATRLQLGTGRSFGAWTSMRVDPSVEYGIALERTELLEIASSAFEHLRVMSPIAAEALFDAIACTDAVPSTAASPERREFA